MTQKEQQALLNALKLELQFCESGGYNTLGGKASRARERE